MLHNIVVCVYIYIYVCIYIYIYICVCVYIYIYIYMCICVCVCVYKYTQCPPLILAPLINMSKGSCENKSALFILLIFHSEN